MTSNARHPFGWTLSIAPPEPRLRDRLRSHKAPQPTWGDAAYDVRVAVLTQALALANLSVAATSSSESHVPSHVGAGSGASAAEDRFRWAVDAQCRAAGALAWVRHHHPFSTHGTVPPSVQASGSDALNKVILAQAQGLAIRKLLAPVAAYANPTNEARTLKEKGTLGWRREAQRISAGASWIQSPLPLPSNHPAPALLAKLYLHAAGL